MLAILTRKLPCLESIYNDIARFYILILIIYYIHFSCISLVRVAFIHCIIKLYDMFFIQGIFHLNDRLSLPQFTQKNMSLPFQNQDTLLYLFTSAALQLSKSVNIIVTILSYDHLVQTHIITVQQKATKGCNQTENCTSIKGTLHSPQRRFI